MTEPSASGPMTHGFLFADLRGYTAYAEARGDAAAADLLDRYRILVRAVLSDLGGAEIKTEGDSLYVVFPSASRAVAAGLAIVVRAAEANAIDPAQPIQVGVGIHAGEAEERAEGYVGTAVNIAARVCAQARPGEVLVTETVRSLTRTGGRYRFVARGRATLKGISEPVAVFAAQDASVGSATSERPARSPSTRSATAIVGLIAVIAIAGLAVVAVGLLGSGHSSAPPSGLPEASPVVATSPAASSRIAAVPSAPLPFTGPQAFHTGRLAPGTYQSTVMQPPIQFTVPAGWNGVKELSNYLEIDRFDDDSQQLVFMAPSVGYAACSLTEYSTLPSGREDLVKWLQANKGLAVRLVGSVKLGDVEAQQLDVGLGDGCKGQSVQRLFLIQTTPNATTGDDRWVVTPGPPEPVYIVSAGDRSLVAMVGSPASKLDTFLVDVRTVLSSLEIQP
jgi:class 3 adenylate cyclase